jgi:hypothetical protein
MMGHRGKQTGSVAARTGGGSVRLHESIDAMESPEYTSERNPIP